MIPIPTSMVASLVANIQPDLIHCNRIIGRNNVQRNNPLKSCKLPWDSYIPIDFRWFQQIVPPKHETSPSWTLCRSELNNSAPESAWKRNNQRGWLIRSWVELYISRQKINIRLLNQNELPSKIPWLMGYCTGLWCRGCWGLWTDKSNGESVLNQLGQGGQSCTRGTLQVDSRKNHPGFTVSPPKRETRLPWKKVIQIDEMAINMGIEIEIIELTGLTLAARPLTQIAGSLHIWDVISGWFASC